MRILIADDDKSLRKILLTELAEEGFSVYGAEDGFGAVKALEKEEYDVLLLDLNLPGMDGIEVLKKIKANEFPIEVIMLTAYASIPTAVEAIKLGAYDYLMKPFKFEELKAIIRKAYERKSLIQENLILKTRIDSQVRHEKVITRNPLMCEVLNMVDRVADSHFPILVCGKSGVGKEIVAREIHERSVRAARPFIPINCGAIPETMLESELFGHEKGAFTGAHTRKLGLLEVASGGTLFLDEIADMSPQLQVKLLRAIETGTFFRIGGTREVHVNVRYVSATHKDLRAEIEKGNFREDLYYRISAFTITIPSLSERKEDIPPLVEHFIRCSTSHRNKRFTDAALKALTEYQWPGNIRELQNVVNRALLLSKHEVIDLQDLPDDLTTRHHRTEGTSLEEIERTHILHVLESVHGNKKQAAELLGIDPKTLYRKLAAYGVTC